MRARFGATAPNAALQPALLARHPVGLDAVADAELADRLGQVVAHRAVREVELDGDVAGRPALARQPQHLALAVVERVGVAPGVERQLRIDRAPAAMHLAQRFGQVLGRCILEQVARPASLDRPAQEPGPRDSGARYDLAPPLLAPHAAPDLPHAPPGLNPVGDTP